MRCSFDGVVRLGSGLKKDSAFALPFFSCLG
jgi:hypothetical protein